MRKLDADQTENVRELRSDEIDNVAGGMKWTRGTTNSDVVDARGGTIKFFGMTIALDRNGKVSAVY